MRWNWKDINWKEVSLGFLSFSGYLLGGFARAIPSQNELALSNNSVTKHDTTLTNNDNTIQTYLNPNSVYAKNADDIRKFIKGGETLVRNSTKKSYIETLTEQQKDNLASQNNGTTYAAQKTPVPTNQKPFNEITQKNKNSITSSNMQQDSQPTNDNDIGASFSYKYSKDFALSPDRLQQKQQELFANGEFSLKELKSGNETYCIYYNPSDYKEVFPLVLNYYIVEFKSTNNNCNFKSNDPAVKNFKVKDSGISAAYSINIKDLPDRGWIYNAEKDEYIIPLRNQLSVSVVMKKSQPEVKDGVLMLGKDVLVRPDPEAPVIESDRKKIAKEFIKNDDHIGAHNYIKKYVVNPKEKAELLQYLTPEDVLIFNRHKAQVEKYVQNNEPVRATKYIELRVQNNKDRKELFKLVPPVPKPLPGEIPQEIVNLVNTIPMSEWTKLELSNVACVYIASLNDFIERNFVFKIFKSDVPGYPPCKQLSNNSVFLIIQLQLSNISSENHSINSFKVEKNCVVIYSGSNKSNLACLNINTNTLSEEKVKHVVKLLQEGKENQARDFITKNVIFGIDKIYDKASDKFLYKSSTTPPPSIDENSSFFKKIVNAVSKVVVQELWKNISPYLALPGSQSGNVTNIPISNNDTNDELITVTGMVTDHP